MPVHKVSGGYKWGKHGKVYPNKAGAERQARAAYAHGYEGKAFDPMEAVVELAGGVYGDKTYIGRDEISGVPKDRTVFQGPNGGLFYFHEGDKPAPRNAKVVRQAGQDGGQPATPDKRPQEDPAKAERSQASRFDEMPSDLVDHINQTVASVEREPGESLNSYVERVKRATVSMYRPGLTRELSTWIHSGPGLDFLDMQRSRQRRAGVVRNLILDELERRGSGKMNNSYLSDMVDLAMEESDLIAKAAPGSRRRRTDPQTFERKKTKEEHFAVHEDDSGERVPLPKERHYLKEGEEAPPSVFVQEGPRGGRFYEVPARGKAQAEEPAKAGAGSMAVVADQPSDNPTREVKPTPSTSQTVDVEDPYASTIARIKEALGRAKIPQAELLPNGRHNPGYEINARDDSFEVYGRGRNDEESAKVFRVVARALEASDELNVSVEDDHAVVEALEGDPAADLFDEGIDTELDPLLSEKSWSHDEAILASGLIAKGVDPSAVAAAISASRVSRLV